MSETLTTEQIEDKLSSMKYSIGCIQDDLQTLLDWIDKQTEMRDELDKKATEEAFDFLLQNGFNIGTRFGYKEVLYEITGICCDGFRIKRVDGEETRITLLPARDKIQLEKAMPNFKIVRGKA